MRRFESRVEVTMRSLRESGDERSRIGGYDADERAVLPLTARGSDGRAELVEACQEPVDEPAHVRLDRGNAHLRDDGPSLRRRGRATAPAAYRCRSAVRRVRRVVGDGHREDVLVGEPARLRRQQRTAKRLAQPHEAEPGRAEQVLHRSARDDVDAERANVELDRAERLVAVGEHDRAVGVRELGDRGDVVPVTRSKRDRRAADERSPLVDRLGKALERDAPVRLWSYVDDLGAAQLLRMRDLADGRELVLADDDAVPLAREVECRDECADALRDGSRDRDVVGRGVHETGESGCVRPRFARPRTPTRRRSRPSRRATPPPRHGRGSRARPASRSSRRRCARRSGTRPRAECARGCTPASGQGRPCGARRAG